MLFFSSVVLGSQLLSDDREPLWTVKDAEDAEAVEYETMASIVDAAFNETAFNTPLPPECRFDVHDLRIGFDQSEVEEALDVLKSRLALTERAIIANVSLHSLVLSSNADIECSLADSALMLMSYDGVFLLTDLSMEAQFEIENLLINAELAGLISKTPDLTHWEWFLQRYDGFAASCASGGATPQLPAQQDLAALEGQRAITGHSNLMDFNMNVADFEATQTAAAAIALANGLGIPENVQDPKLGEVLGFELPNQSESTDANSAGEN